METIAVHDGETHFLRLVERAAAGEAFIISKAGKPMVKVIPFDSPTSGHIKRLGFLTGQILVPDDFDRMGDGEIGSLFVSNK